MKLTILLITAACLTVRATGYSQSVTLSLKDVKLEKAFKEIEKQTGFNFIYGKKQLSDASRISIEAKNESFQSVLDRIFKDQPLTYSLSEKYIIVKQRETAPPVNSETPAPIDVRGRVLNEKGEPVEGATVTEKGTKNATATNVDGFFVLKGVDKDAILVFSGVNIETYEVSVNGKSDLADISVKTKITTGETVVVEANTGYQKIKPNEINGSLSVIDNKTLNQQTGTNILDRLVGVTPGLYLNIGKHSGNPQNTTNISIRGQSTINGPLDPLIILDNFIFDGDINNINPHDVESITILKDAEATNKWGTRAGNGVIVITTKMGRFNQKLKIEYNSNLIVTRRPDLYSRPEISVSDYINVEQYLFDKGYFDADIYNSTNPGLTPAVEVFLRRRNGAISATDSANLIDALKKLDSRDDYNKYFYQDKIIQQHALSLRGGSGNMSWLVSGAYDKTVSELKGKSDKINLHVANTYKPAKNLLLEIGAYITSNRNRGPEAPSYNSINIDNIRNVPYLRFADDDGNALSVATFYRESYTDTAGAGHLLNWKYYPLEDYKHMKLLLKRNEVIANISLKYQVIKGLDLDLMYQYQKQNTSSENLFDKESYSTRNTINRFARLSTTGGVDTFRVPKGDVLKVTSRHLRSQNLRFQFNINKKWDDHAVIAYAGSEIRESITTNNSSYTLYGYSKDPSTVASVDYFNSYPTYNGGVSTIPGAPTKINLETYRFISLFGSADYTYKKRYSADISMRKDGSNIFGASTNDKWNPLWSAGLGWQLSNEKFFHLKQVSYLKFRATVGYSGNLDLRKTPLPVAGYFTSIEAVYPFVRLRDGINDPALSWEKVMQWNTGFDFSIKKNLLPASKVFLTGSIEFYFKRGLDLYGEVPFDYTAGGTLNRIITNVANMEGHGIEISLQSKNIDGIFKWTTNLIFNSNSTRTTKYFGPDGNTIFSMVSSGSSITPVVGKPLYAIAAYKWGGLNASGDPQGYINGQLSTDYLGINMEGIEKGTAGNIIYIGPSNPTLWGSLRNEISWKGFSAVCNIVYNLGYYFRKPTLSYSALYSLGAGNKEFEKRWQKPGDELLTNVPAMVYSSYPLFSYRDQFYAFAEPSVLKADNIRLQFVRLDYSVERKNKKSAFESFQLYVTVANLGIIWRANKEKIDPDYPSALTPSKQFTIGMRAGF